MKVQQAVAQMHAQGLLDEREIYAYAQADSAIGGALGAMMNIVLITVNGNRISVFKGNIDNTWGQQLISADKSELSDLKIKNVFFGMQKKFSFALNGQRFCYVLTGASSKKLIEFLK